VQRYRTVEGGARDEVRPPRATAGMHHHYFTLYARGPVQGVQKTEAIRPLAAQEPGQEKENALARA